MPVTFGPSATTSPAGPSRKGIARADARRAWLSAGARRYKVDGRLVTDKIIEIVSLAPFQRALYLLYVSYERGEGGNAAGQLYRTDASRTPVLEPVLNTNDTVRRLWGSPSGAVWASSESGNVFTSAAVSWPAPTQSALDVRSLVTDMPFHVTTLPPATGKGHSPTLGKIWGTGDDNVFVAAEGGAIFRWDGRRWAESFSGAGNVRAFCGSGSDDVYAVGERGTLLHFDGSVWSRAQLPDGVTSSDTFTGCASAADGSVTVCSISGRVLRGSRSGWSVLAQSDRLQFMDVALLNGRVLLASRADGCTEWSAGGFVQAKGNFHPVEIVPAAEKLFMLAVTERPSYVEYDPANTQRPWTRIIF